MALIRQMPIVTGVANGESIRTTDAANNWGISIQIFITGTHTVAIEGSIDGAHWIQLTGDRTSDTIFNLSQTGPIAYLRLIGKAGTGTTVATIMELH